MPNSKAKNIFSNMVICLVERLSDTTSTQENTINATNTK